VDDLAFIEADAILRPADDGLAPITSAAARLDQHAGPRFAALCRVSMPLDAGVAVVTGSGDLTAPLVVHLVLQDHGRTATGRETIQRALQSAWQRARDWNLEHVASPPIGMGPGRLSLEEAVLLLAESFPRDGSAPRTLRIVVERDEERELADAVLRSRRA